MMEKTMDIVVDETDLSSILQHALQHVDKGVSICAEMNLIVTIGHHGTDHGTIGIM